MGLLNRGWLAMLLLAAVCVPLCAGGGTEYELKAAFLYKFAGFVTWPEAPGWVPIGICIVGQDPFGGYLDEVVKGKAMNGREFVVRRLKAEESPAECQILFVSSSERKKMKALLLRMHGEGILTVGDIPEFCESGGAINFEMVDRRVQLQINPTAAERAGLHISSRLLSLARLVRDAGGAR